MCQTCQTKLLQDKFQMRIAKLGNFYFRIENDERVDVPESTYTVINDELNSPSEHFEIKYYLPL